MFKSILPLLAGCTSLSLIIVPGDNDELTVSVIPLLDKESKVPPVVNTSICLTDTAEELDVHFADLVAKHSAVRASLMEQLEASTSIMEAAKKDAEAKAAGAMKKAAKPVAPKPGAAPASGSGNDDDNGGAQGSDTAQTATAGEELNLFA
ncbi:MAG: PRTRC system protein E [Sulfuritalea sp.]|nr:PRTRC system protein E [Sulfuritalea sp.]